VRGVVTVTSLKTRTCTRSRRYRCLETHVKTLTHLRPRCRTGKCGKWRRPLIRNPDYVAPKPGDPGGQRGSGVTSRVPAAGALAARVAWAKSMGEGVDLEDAMGKHFACHTARALVATARRQVGGPLASYQSGRAAPARFGANRPESYGFVFNASKCHVHVRKAVSGSLSVRKHKIAQARADKKAKQDQARQIHITPGQGISMAEMIRKSQEAADDTPDEPLSECMRAKHAHERCTNDNPVGSHGFENCCRALAGLLLACERRAERGEGDGCKHDAPARVHTSAHTLKQTHTHAHAHQVSCLHAWTTVRIYRQICALSTPPPTTTTVLHPGTCRCQRILQTALLLSASASFLRIDRCKGGSRFAIVKFSLVP
jgi:hypothetical protein